MDVHTRHDRLDTGSLDGWRTNYGDSSKYVIGAMIREERAFLLHASD